MKEHISKAFTPVMKHYGNDSLTTQVWNLKMTSLECCGINGYEDFKDLNKSINIASICCNIDDSECTAGSITQNKNDSILGCVDKVFTDMKDEWMHAIIVAGVVIAIEILGIALALGLTNSMGNNSYDDDDVDGMQMEGRHGRIDSMFSG